MSFRPSAHTEDFDLLARMDVRYMLGSRVNQARSGVICRHSARRGHICFALDCVAKVENRSTPKISRKSIFGLFQRCEAPYSAYEGLQSFFRQTMWSLTSLRTKRISGVRKFRSSAPKDFRNSIPRKQTSEPSSVVSALDRAEAKKLPPPSMPTVRFEPIVADLNVKPWPCGMRS
jgi:hypothetical protein